MPKCFLDRDGVINKHLPYVGTKDRFFWHQEIFEILLILKEYNYDFILVTNQSGIGRGYFTFGEFFDLCDLIIDSLNNHKIKLKIRFCPHTPEDKCFCRKPNIGMLAIDSISEKDIFIGDQISDMECAFNSGIKNRWLINNQFNSDLATRRAKKHSEVLANLNTWLKNDIFNI